MSSKEDREYEEGAAGTKTDRKKDSTKEYDEKEPMSPAKIREHEPTAVSRDASDQKITEEGQTGSSQDAAEKARRSGMTKGTAGAAETGSEYEQGAAGSNK
ncbi:MAG: hypothetical protein WCF06_08745 [Nitrososphaeraceae archaeon]|jgi:hypothetical protein